jgi:hypothetical protein
MDLVITHLLDEPVANLIALAGLFFLFVAAVGKISGKVEPDRAGRVICGLLGLILIPVGLMLHAAQDSKGEPRPPKYSGRTGRSDHGATKANNVEAMKRNE